MSNEIEWRRKWKPDLRSLPWQMIDIEGTQYLIKCRFSVNGYELLVTDLKQFWYEEISDTQLKKRIQKLNPSIEADVTRILDQIKNCLENQEKGTTLSVSFKDEGENGEEKMILKINSQLAGMPFSWNFVASTADKEMASDNLIIPLLAMVGELSRRQKELMKIIAAKDKEIDDYKSQGVKTSRKHIETPEFVSTAFENEMLTSKEFLEEVRHLGRSGFSEDCQDLYRQIMTKHAWVNRSPSKDNAAADDFLDSDSLQDAGKKSSSGPSWGSNRLPPSINTSKSPNKSPDKSPRKGSSSAESSPVKDTELLRRQALERRLEEEEKKKQEPKKKKKKIAF